MIDELLKELKRAIQDHNIKTQKEIVKILNRAGMDTTTIIILLREV
jgi:arginine repressor